MVEEGGGVLDARGGGPMAARTGDRRAGLGRGRRSSRRARTRERLMRPRAVMPQ